MASKQVPPGLDPKIADFLSHLVQSEIKNLQSFIEENTQMLKRVTDELSEIKLSLNHVHNRVDKVKDVFLPALTSRVQDIAISLAERILDMDVHSRKWSLVISGCQGAAGENDATTREKCVQLARDIGVSGAGDTRFAACHRLRHNVPNSNIILRFTDLSDREAWLAKAMNLPSIDTSLSMSPDLPPVLRQLKNELLRLRRDLPIQEKKNTRVRYLPHFPYVEMIYKDHSKEAVRPTKTKEQLLKDILGYSPLVHYTFDDAN